jgi:hypothetical protein
VAGTVSLKQPMQILQRSIDQNAYSPSPSGEGR